MQKINKEVLLEAAHNLMFDISEDEIAVLLEECDDILKAVELIKTLKSIDEVEPMVFPYEIKTTYLREDVAISPLSQEDALKNACRIKDQHIVIPKVVK